MTLRRMRFSLRIPNTSSQAELGPSTEGTNQGRHTADRKHEYGYQHLGQHVKLSSTKIGRIGETQQSHVRPLVPETSPKHQLTRLWRTSKSFRGAKKCPSVYCALPIQNAKNAHIGTWQRLTEIDNARAKFAVIRFPVIKSRGLVYSVRQVSQLRQSYRSSASAPSNLGGWCSRLLTRPLH